MKKHINFSMLSETQVAYINEKELMVYDDCLELLEKKGVFNRKNTIEKNNIISKITECMYEKTVSISGKKDEIIKKFVYGYRFALKRYIVNIIIKKIS